MKWYIIIIAAMLSLAVSSCQLETSGNGKLDGYWRLERIDAIETGKTIDLKEHLIFWAFQHDLLDLVDRKGKSVECLMRFEKAGEHLKVFSPYIYNRESGDEALQSPNLLYPYGIYQTEVNFKILQLSYKRMRLSSSDVILTFQRY